MVSEQDVQQLLDDLALASAAIAPALTNQAAADVAIQLAQADLAGCKRVRDDAIVRATAAAMFGAGTVVDAKNAEGRKAQLDACLLLAPAVICAEALVELAEKALLDAETSAEQTKADARIALAKAGIAQHGAALVAAFCNLLAAPTLERATEYEF